MAAPAEPSEGKKEDTVRGRRLAKGQGEPESLVTATSAAQAERPGTGAEAPLGTEAVVAKVGGSSTACRVVSWRGVARLHQHADGHLWPAGRPPRPPPRPRTGQGVLQDQVVDGHLSGTGRAARPQ